MRTSDNPVAVAPQTHPQHHRTPLLAGSCERPIRHARDLRHLSTSSNAPLMWSCIPIRTSGRTCRIRTPDAIQPEGRNIHLSCPADPRRRLRLSVLHRLKVAVSVVLADLNPKTAAANGVCSATQRETTRWNLIQCGSTAQPNPPFLGTNRPCQAQASGTPPPAHAP